MAAIVHNTDYMLLEKYKKAGIAIESRSYGGRFKFLTFLNLVLTTFLLTRSFFFF